MRYAPEHAPASPPLRNDAIPLSQARGGDEEADDDGEDRPLNGQVKFNVSPAVRLYQPTVRVSSPLAP